MGELGDNAAVEHDAVGRLAVRLNISQTVAVGATAAAIHSGAAMEGSYDGQSVAVPDGEAALAFVRAGARPGDVVLVKARAERARVTILRSSGSSALLSVMPRAYEEPARPPGRGVGPPEPDGAASRPVQPQPLGARQARHHQVVGVLDQLPDQPVREPPSTVTVFQ